MHIKYPNFEYSSAEAAQHNRNDVSNSPKQQKINCLIDISKISIYNMQRVWGVPCLEILINTAQTPSLTHTAPIEVTTNTEIYGNPTVRASINGIPNPFTFDCFYLFFFSSSFSVAVVSSFVN